jgi:hypothetical protein
MPILEPCKIIGMEGYGPLLPWSAPVAAVQLLHLAELEETQPFLTLQELDNEFDAWPELGNPFILIDTLKLPWNQSKRKNGINSLNQNKSNDPC